MKFCPNCGNKKNYQMKKCDCGFVFQFVKKQFVPQDEHINEFTDKKSLVKKDNYTKGTIFSLIILVVSVFISYQIVPFAAIFALIVFINFNSDTLSSQQYHELAGGLNSEGKHQCLFCGHQGIYRSTPYRTNTTNCQCSKCKEHLFDE